MFSLSAIFRIVCSTGLLAVTAPSLAEDDGSAAPRIDEPSIGDAAPNADSTISRDEWRLRIDTARARAVQARRQWWLHPPAPGVPEPADKVAGKIATERVLNDDTLQPGDIVSTDKGMLLFRGRPGAEGQPGDFVPLPDR